MFDLRDRTKSFALRIVKLYTALPKTTEAQVLGKQVLRSGTSVGAHYREAIRARSNAEYISKIEVGLQELEESIYWLELLAEAGIVKALSSDNGIGGSKTHLSDFPLETLCENRPGREKKKVASSPPKK
jgi:four helix bundle protein